MLTAAFVHGGLLHFGVNFMALMALGRDTETYAGQDLLPVVFLGSILGGTALGILLPPDVASVGNSGGLVGVIAFLGVLAWRRPGQVPPGFLNAILLNVALLLGIGVVGYALIDNAGHAGGGLVGAALGLAFIPTARRKPVWAPGRAWKVAGWIAMAILAAAAGLTARLVLRG
jgi:rhomboid protease GluP